MSLARFHRIESVTPRDPMHYFRLRTEDDLDPELAALLAEAYRVGCQETSPSE